MLIFRFAENIKIWWYLHTTKKQTFVEEQDVDIHNIGGERFTAKIVKDNFGIYRLPSDMIPGLEKFHVRIGEGTQAWDTWIQEYDLKKL